MNSQLLAHVEIFKDDDDSNSDHCKVQDGGDDGDDRSENDINDEDDSDAEVDNDNDDENDEGRHLLAESRLLQSHENNGESMKGDTTKSIILVATSSIVSFIAGNVVSSRWTTEEATFLFQYGPTAAIMILVIMITVISITILSVSQVNNQNLRVSVTEDPIIQSTSESSRSDFGTEIYNNRKESQLDECRRDVSRILGLIGAPPLQWMTETSFGTTKSIATTSDDESRERKYYRHHQPQSHTTSSPAYVRRDYFPLIYEYFKNHAQLLLAVDECYYWIKVTSGLHLGLGPRSQATERAELAYISRSQTTTTTAPSSVSKVSKADAETTKSKEKRVFPLSIQNRIDTGTILSLSSTRRSVAKILSQQSTSILALYRSIVKDNSDEEKDDEDLLVVPSVVTLAWIKAARKHVGQLLSDCANIFLMIRSFDDRSQYGLYSAHFLQQLTNSIKNSKQACEYVKSNILSSIRIERTDSTDSLSSAIPIRGHSSTQSSQKLIPYLIHHHEKMEGLTAAMKVVYEYYHHDHRGNDPHGNDPNILRWWNEVKHWSASLVAVEREIEARFFAQDQCSKDSEEIDEDKDQKNDTRKLNLKSETTRNYEFNHETTPKIGPEPSSTMKLKTLVFKGKGAVEPRPQLRPDARAQNINGTRGSREHPSRDVADWMMTEHMFVQELQKRVRSLLPAEEDVEEHETEVVDEIDSSEYSNDDCNNGNLNREEDVSVQSLHDKDTTKTTRSSSKPIAFIPTGLDGTSFLAELQQVSFLDQEEEDHNMDDLQLHTSTFE